MTCSPTTVSADQSSQRGEEEVVAYAMADSPLGPFRRIGRILEQGLIAPVRITREGVEGDPMGGA